MEMEITNWSDSAYKKNKKKKVVSKAGEIEYSKRYTSEAIPLLISPEKVEILNLFDKEIDIINIIGGKDTGKSYIGYAKALATMEEDKDNQVFMLRKYKQGATNRFHSEIANIRIEAEAKGYKIPVYEKNAQGSCSIRRIRKENQKNQEISYFSFDTTDAIAGISGKNFSKIPFILLDEPVIEGDTNVPTPKEWSKSFKMLTNSIARINRRYASFHKKAVPSTKYMLAMNAWDNHPIIVEAEILFPERKFLKWVVSDLLNNHTAQVLDEKNRTAWVRMTKFANPVINALEKIKLELAKIEDYPELGLIKEMVDDHVLLTPQVERALKDKDSFELANILGLKYDSTEASQRTYNTDTIETTDTHKFIKENRCKLEGFAVGVDVDLNRRLVFTPIYVVKWMSELKYVKNLLIGKQVIVELKGTKDVSKVVPILNETLQEIVNMTMVLFNITEFKGAMLGNYLYVDDNQDHVLSQLRDWNNSYWYGIFGTMEKAQKHGDWKIIPRQNNFIVNSTRGYYILDKDNIFLLDALSKCVNDIKGQREEKNRTQKKMMDFIDSMEYSITPFRYEGGAVLDKEIGIIPEKEGENE